MLGTAGEFVDDGRRRHHHYHGLVGHVVAVSLDVLLVIVAHGVVQLLVDAAREDEGRERVEVRQQNDSVDDLGE